MKLPRSTLLWCVLIVCLTLLIFTYLTRKSLCEIRYRDTTGRWRLLWPTNPLSSQPRRRATSAVQGLNCLDMPEAR
jgi:protein HokB